MQKRSSNRNGAIDRRPRPGEHLGRALLVAALTLAGPLPRLAAQGCPTQTVTVNRPANNGSNLCGTVRIDISLSTPPAGWTQQSVTCQIQDLVGGIYEQGLCYQINPTTYAYLADTTLIKNAFYKVIILTNLYNPTTMQTCPQQNAVVPQFNVVNPGTVRQISLVKQRGGFTRNPVRTASNTDPETGDQNFTVPITSWDYKGATIPFFLEYDSVGMTDPQQPVEPNFSGLSERNSHWTHPFAQWIDLAADPTNAGAPMSAVWHHGNSTLYFVNGPNNTWDSPDSYHSLVGDGVMASQTVTCDNTGMPMSDPDPVPNSSFTLTDGDNTKYSFGGGSNIYWEVVGCMALPHYLLTKITDRWGRSLTITWGSVQGTTEPRVTGVADDTGTGVTLLYTNGLISSIKDPQNRSHTLKYTEVPSEIGTSFNKLTSVQAFGPGDVTRVTYNWSFSYQDPNDPQNLAYGGAYTGDLIIHKTDPAGVTCNYFYEAVSLVGTGALRLTEGDWDGRVSKITWTDTDGTAREIDRSPLNNSTDTITYFPSTSLPGGIPVTYGFDPYDNTVMVQDVINNRTWNYAYDLTNATTVHNLVSVKTPSEAAGSNLVQWQYMYSNTNQISRVVETVLQEAGLGGGQGDPVTTVFNPLNQPTMITATGRTGAMGHPNQVTVFHIDKDVPIGPNSPGNLTGIDEAMGQPEHLSASFTYGGTAGMWGLPDTATNEVGGISMFGYDSAGAHPSGRLTTAASPVDTARGMGDPDYNASVTTLAYNGDGLPSLVMDPMGHSVAVGYNAACAGSPNLVVALTYPPYGNQRFITIDPRGRVLADQDQAQVLTAWSYNNEDQVTAVTRALGTTDQATAVFHYNAQDDLDYFIPPGGASGQVNFEYFAYLQNGTQVMNPPYQGQVTRIRYPDATNEYFGYNSAAELAWRVKADGTLINIQRDVLHRIKEIDYPAGTGDGPLSVITNFDEFGRPANTTDRRGMTTLGYDSLNRLTVVMPPSPQKQVNYGYSADASLHRWTTTAQILNVGSPYQYKEDSKGRLWQLVNPLNQTTGLKFDLDGKNTEVDFPNGTTELRGYVEPQDWLASIQLKQQNGSVKDQLNYSYFTAQGNYDPTGHIQAETNLANQVHAFSFDKRYELTAEVDPTLGMIAYGLDLNGNRTSRTDSTGTDYYGLDANNKLLWVNHGTNTVPTSGQAGAYMLFGYL